MNRSTEEPQRTDSSRADAEWKADPAHHEIVHGAHVEGSDVDRASKAANAPDFEFNNASQSGGDTRKSKGWTGSGKGPLNPEEDMPKKIAADI